jgi:uncharacterized membrane protein
MRAPLWVLRGFYVWPREEASLKHQRRAHKQTSLQGWAGQVDSFLAVFGDRIVLALILLFTAVFGTLCVRKYLSYGYTDFDLANDVAVYWNTLHGRFFYNPFMQECVLGGHFYAFALLVLPIFALVPHAITVLLIQVIFLALPAWPLYRLAREKTGEATFPVLIAFFYLIYPCVGFIALWEAHFDAFTILFFALALLYFERERFWPFFLALLLAVSVKENASFVVFMFGVYGLLRRRPWRWVLAPGALGFLWFVIVMKWLIPSFAAKADDYVGGYLFAAFYQHFGNNMFEVIKNILLHPFKAIAYCLAGPKLYYIPSLLAPTGGLAFLSPAVLLMTIPIFAQNLLSSRATHSMITFHYTAMMIPFFFAAFIGGYRRFVSFPWWARRRGFLWIFLIVANIASGIYLHAPQIFLARQFKSTRITELAHAKDRLIAQIPKDASVMASFQFSSRLALRFNVCTNHFVSTGYKMNSNVAYVPPEHLEYAIFDFNEPLLLTDSFWYARSPDNFRRFLEKSNWGVMEMFNDVVLFKKNSPGAGPLVSIVAAAQPEKKLGVNLGGGVELLGLDEKTEVTSVGRMVHFVFYWKRTGWTPNLGLILRMAGPDGKDILDQTHMIGYRVYPAPEWPKDAVLAERYSLYIPAVIPAGSYGIRLTAFSLADTRIIPFSGQDATKPFNVIEVRNIEIPGLADRGDAA